MMGEDSGTIDEKSGLFNSVKHPTSALNNPDQSNIKQDFSEFSLDDWINKFGRIYGKRHEKHTTEYMISRLVEEVAELVNPMEAQDNQRIAPNLSDVFSWICSIAYKLNLDLSGLAWKKYGTNAPRPSWTTLQPSLSDFSEPRSLKEWQEFISQLYQAENKRVTPMNALVAMMKDVGDVAMLHRKRAASDQIASKIASILAWTITLAELLRLNLAEIVFAKYDEHCPMCKQQVCDTDICHPLATIYVSFGGSCSDEEKYVILDTCASFGLRVLVNSSATVQATKDLSASLDEINNSDAACILLSTRDEGTTEYRQVFETLACYSILSRGNVFIFAKDPAKGLGGFLSDSFASENIAVSGYTDPGNLKAIMQKSMEDLYLKRKDLSKPY
ncbi:MAG: hypothetical protein ACYC7D_01100 [Nitrososphaerales archaeon]